MSRNTCVICFTAFGLAAMVGCSSKPSAEEAKKAEIPLQKIQGKAEVGVESGGASEAALNAGGPSVYITEGARRYRLFLRKATQVTNGGVYVAEGIYAQKAIDEIGDPDQGKNGYPLRPSCERVVHMAWTNLAFDEADAFVGALSGKIHRFPARPVFLVVRLREATDAEKTAAKGDKKEAVDGKDIKVPADKQKALLIAGPAVLPAPLWQSQGGTVKCKLMIGTDGKVESLETGIQLCEAVPWSEFSYKPTLEAGKPVNVETEVEVRFEPKK